MNLAQLQFDHAYCLERAAAVLGAPVRAVSLTWSVEQLLRMDLRVDGRCGLESPHPLLSFASGPKGQTLEYGVESFRLEIGGRVLRLAHVVAPHVGDNVWNWYEFWAVPVEHHRRLYRHLRRLERNSLDVAAPIMRDGDRQRLWSETIGFLARGRRELQTYGVPQKRGIMLLGMPGNGKTLACRWLLSLCHKRGLLWRSVSAEEFNTARGAGGVRALFELDGPGMILFDDLDQALRDGEGSPADRSTFLTELDGLHPRQGVVYLFTSNARVSDLDPAFRRPGRIDLFVHFPRPDAELRRRFIIERWHADIIGAIDLDEVVRVADGLSFAELDEVKKLLVLRFLETQEWNWEAAWSAYCDGHGGGKPAQRIGFNSPAVRNRKNVDALVTQHGA